MAIVAVLAVIYGLKQVAQDGPAARSRSARSSCGLVVGAALGPSPAAARRPDDRRRRSSACRAFNAALAVNFLAIFVAVGYFLFIAQYLQLVVGLSPLEAGLLSLPSAIGVHRRLAGRAADRARASGRRTSSAAGSRWRRSAWLMLTQVGVETGCCLWSSRRSSSRSGLAPVFGLTTELIVGSAPPERAGAASGICETGAELGGALGHRDPRQRRRRDLPRRARRALPAGVPAEAATAARDTLGGAVERRRQLPAGVGDGAARRRARSPSSTACTLAAAIAAVVAVGLAVFAYITLRERGTERSETEPTCVEPTMIDQPVLNPLAKPARECF